MLLKELLFIIISLFISSCVDTTQTELEFEEIDLNNNGIVNGNLDSLSGEEIYSQNCKSCHGDILVTDKANSSASEIKNAIQNISMMQYLDFLTDAHINKIQEALSFQAPEISSPAPFGELNSSTSSVSLEVRTNEASLCKYDVSDKSFNQMEYSFVASSNQLFHSKMISVGAGNSYSYYARCRDIFDNESISTLISFSIADAGSVDTTGPVLNNFTIADNESFPSGTSTLVIGFATNENATCRYSNNVSDNYSQMTQLASTGGTSHNQTLSSLSNGQSYAYYIMCSDGSSNLSVKKTLAFSISSLELNGDVLYANNCASCHNALNSSTKKNRTSAQIQNAINGITSMQSLSFLETQQLMEIAKSLSYEPPVLSNLLPFGELASTTTQVILEVKTNEAAYCRYANTDKLYSQMTQNFNSESDLKSHTKTYSVASGNSYTFYVRCIDVYSNEVTSSSVINFSVKDAAQDDTTAPIISSISPASGVELNSGTTSLSLSFSTNEVSECRYSNNSSHSFNQMTKMNSTESQSHSHDISGLSDGNTYNYYFMCTDTSSNISNKLIYSFSVKSGGIDGAALYANRCANCHNVLESSTKRNRTSEQISSAIVNINAMDRPELNSLTTEELDAIAYALDFTNNPGTIDQEKLNIRLRVGGRRYVEGILNEIFNLTPGENGDLKQKIYENATFGGGCDNYAAVILGYTGSEFHRERCYSNMSVKLTPVFSPMRAGRTTLVCEKLLYKNEYFDRMAPKFGGYNQGWSNQNFDKLYDLFYLEETPSSVVRLKFKDLFETQSNNKEAWRVTALGVCVSPEWQTIQ